VNINLGEEARFEDQLIDWPLPIDRVLYEAEQPIVYLSHSKYGQHLLVYLANETTDASYLIIATTSISEVKMLEQGVLGVREALCSDWMWLARCAHRPQKVELWTVVEDDIPNEYLPIPGTPLLPEHSVVFSARAIGEEIRLGRMPCSVISLVADSVRTSLKTILDYVRSANAGGRPTDAQRVLYDLPVQYLRFASFEVGLAEPDTGLFPDESLKLTITCLERGLSWAESPSDEALSLGDTSEEREAVLRATLALTPPSTGLVHSIEISGTWLNGKQFHLSRDSRIKVKHHLRNLRSEKIVVYSGRIGEIDDDNLSFILRDSDDKVDRKGFFPEELLDDMRTHYYESNRIQISGIELGGRLRVTAVVEITSTKGA